MPFDYAISAFLTLFVVVDPVGLTPTFLAVTDGLPRTARRVVAVRASLIAGGILAGSALIGDWLLQTLQISLAAFRIAGGLLLFSIASEMVFGVRIRREGKPPSRRSKSMCAMSPPFRSRFRLWPVRALSRPWFCLPDMRTAIGC